MSELCHGTYFAGTACGRCDRCTGERLNLQRRAAEFWLPWTIAPRDGHPFLATGVHFEAAPAGASKEVKPGDRWWAIAQCDVWRAPNVGRFVFCKDGSPLWAGAVGWMFLPDLPPDVLT